MRKLIEGPIDIPEEVRELGEVEAGVWERLARGYPYKRAGEPWGLDGPGVWRIVNTNRKLFSAVDVRIRPLEGAAHMMLERALEEGLAEDATDAMKNAGVRAASIVMARLKTNDAVRSGLNEKKQEETHPRPSEETAPGSPPLPDFEEEEPERPRLALVSIPVSATQPVRSRPSSRKEVGR